MKRNNVIVMLGINNEPVVRGNFKKLCENFNLPYYTLCRRKFPIYYKDFTIYKIKFE